MAGGPSVVSSTLAVGSAAGAASVRFVAAPGSGLDEVFPSRRDNVGLPSSGRPPNGYPATSIPAAADLSLSTGSPSFPGRDDDGASSACIGDRGQASTASASTQAPELKLSDWANARNR